MKIRIAILALSLAAFSGSLALAAPAATKKPELVPVATCNDGKTMMGTNPAEHRGACSGHGGVASWADGSPARSHGGRKTSYR